MTYGRLYEIQKGEREMSGKNNPKQSGSYNEYEIEVNCVADESNDSFADLLEEVTDIDGANDRFTDSTEKIADKTDGGFKNLLGEIYDEGYQKGYKGGYEKAKQEVLEYKRKNKCQTKYNR